MQKVLSGRALALGRRPSSASADSSDIAALKTGFLFKRGGGKHSTGWKQRWCVLKANHEFYYFETADSVRPKGHFNIRPYTVEDHKDIKRQFCFKLVPPDPKDRTWFLSALSEDQKLSWMEILKTAIKVGTMVNPKAVQIEEKLRSASYKISPEDLEWSSESILGKGSSGTHV